MAKQKKQKAFTPRKPAEPMTEKEVNRLLDHCKGDWRTIFAFTFYSGCRISEVLSLKVSDFEMDTNRFIIPKKRRKNRIMLKLPIPRQCLHAVELTIELTKLKGMTERLWPFSRNTAWKHLREAARLAKIDKTVSPHSLRCTLATLLYQKTGDLKIVQDNLGHADLASSAIYAHSTVEDIRERREAIGL